MRERGLLANARCLAEGVDVPTLDGVAFIDPRRSEVDIVQAVGRAIRLAPDKTVGTIVIPVFIDTDEDPETALDGSAFKPVWDVIKALRSHDDELGEQLDELRRQLGRQGGGRPRLPSKIHRDLPARVGTDFARAFDVRLVEQTTASWEFWFGLLEKFVERYGDALVPKSYVLNGYRLGVWVRHQRNFRFRGSLNAEREHRLEDLPGWTWDVREVDQWEVAFSRLLNYVERHGHARVPDAYTVDGFKLGQWIQDQRSFYARGTLEPDRQRRFENLPGWAWDRQAVKWGEGFSRLLKYVERHGDARVPFSYTEDGYKLGGWVTTQRSFHSRGTLEDDRAHRLEELPGWTWDAYTESWEEGFSRLQAYVERHGDARVPRSWMVDGYKLGGWVIDQRVKRAKGKLDANSERRLQELPGWTWKAATDRWEEGFSQLLDYVKRHGDARVPPSCTVNGYPLGTWVMQQRATHARGGLDAERERRLRDVPGWTWDPRADRWEEGFSRLLDYVESHGHARVPKSHTIDLYKLGGWVGNQRSFHSRGTLDADRQHRLEELPGWTWKASSST